MNLLVRRVAVLVVSVILGFAFTHLGMFLMNTNYVEYGTYFGTDGDGLAYYPLTVISFALFFAIWLDKFFGAEILPK